MLPPRLSLMKIEPGVKLDGVHPVTLFAMVVVGGIFRDHGLDTRITSVMAERPGVHSPRSYHRLGLAFDIGLRDISAEKHEVLARLCQDALGGDFDVVLEDPPHLHVEYDPDV